MTRTSGADARIERELGQRADELLPTAEVEAGTRLVEQEHTGIVHQRAGEQDALLLAGRERADPP